MPTLNPGQKGYYSTQTSVDDFFRKVGRANAMRSAESREVADEAAVVRGQAARRKCVKDWRKKRDKRRKAAEEPMGEEPAPPTPTPTPTDSAPTATAAATDTVPDDAMSSVRK